MCEKAGIGYMSVILILRWFLLPLLLYIAGQYLEGPPYRVIVRSVPFVLACFALSGLAAQYLRQKSDLPLLYYLLQALLVPFGFVFAIQSYYNGGQFRLFTCGAVLCHPDGAERNSLLLLSVFFPPSTKSKRSQHKARHP